jgi:hypothetical protein
MTDKKQTAPKAKKVTKAKKAKKVAKNPDHHAGQLSWPVTAFRAPTGDPAGQRSGISHSRYFKGPKLRPNTWET